MTPADIRIPTDSLLHKYLHVHSYTEVPRSYQICCGLSLIGFVLRRSIWVDQMDWNVWPNMSVLLVGPSGIGKDTAIDQVRAVVRQLMPTHIVGGRTMEYIYERLLQLGTPAAAFIPIPELSAFFGGKDYKKSMVQEFTDLLSTKDVLDVSTKSNPGAIVEQPTPTVQSGTTADWLHVAMPEGSLEGGFVPRFLVVSEDYVEKHVPLVKYSMLPEERRRVEALRKDFLDGVEAIRAYNWGRGAEYVMDVAARHAYADWYGSRIDKMPKNIEAYAVRSRDHVLRMCMLSAVSRGRNFIDIADVEFGISLMDYVAQRLEPAVAPMTREYRCAQDILSLLPATHKELMVALLQRYDRRTIITAEAALLESGKAAQAARTGEFIETQTA